MTSEAVKENYQRLKEVGRPVHLLPWYYIGGTTVTLDGTNPAQVPNIPEDATIVELRARDGEVYFHINGVTATALSPGYVPEDIAEIIGPLYNLERLWLYSATAATVAHVMYFREV